MARQVIFDLYSVRRMAQDCLTMYEQVRRRKYHVVMSGYYGFANAGDDAILESIQQAIHEASDDVSVTVLSNDPELTRKQYGMDAIPRFRMWRVFCALRRSDVLLSGGGSLLQDTTSTRSLMYYLSVIRCADFLGKPVMLYANGIGPVRKPANRRRVKRVVERAALVTLRDHSSARELADMGVTAPTCMSRPTRCSTWPRPVRSGRSSCLPVPGSLEIFLLWRSPFEIGGIQTGSFPSWHGCVTTCAGPTDWRFYSC